KKERTGLILADIVLPTDKASDLSEAVLGKAFEKRLLEKNPALSASDPLPLPNSLNKGSVGLCAGLTAYSFGLEGGAYTLDAACASSLAAISLACEELNSGRADAMLAGGVSRPSCLYTQMGFSALKALSPSGKCSPFDAKADGLMVGEGCGIAVLKRLEDAIADGDKIYAVIKGCGMSNDIGGSLLAPDSEGQLRSLRAAYQDAGLSPRDIDWIECHGTGTPVGDKVEFESLCSLWESAAPAQGTAPADGRCCLTSVKSMIGHLLTAANTAGLFRILLSLEHGQITSQVNYTEPGLPIEQSPFIVPTHTYDWPRRSENTPRRAAVSGFGFGGINAHVIIEEWDPQICQAHACTTNCPAEAASPAESGKPAEVASPVDGSNTDNVPVAIVGMAATTGFAKNIAELRKAIFAGVYSVCEASTAQAGANAPNAQTEAGTSDRADGSGNANDSRCTDSKRQGASIVTIDKVKVPIAKFKIPPADIPSILTQQSLMLNVASEALEDAEIDCSAPSPKAAAIIGLGFDPKASGFHLRWALANKVKKWAKELNLTDEEAQSWLKELRDEINPALDSVRTLGALGSISPSRIAREFRFGGASFAVSGEEASGIRAVEISVRALQKGELDLALAGAIDMSIDPRYLAGAASGNASSNQTAQILHEGAAALVLKRLDDALKDGSKIYGIIKGIGSSSGTAPGQNAASLCRNSAKKACAEAGISPASVSFLESSERFEGAASASLDVFAEGDIPCALNSSPIRAGSLGGLLSLIKTALCLHSRALPPQKDFESLPAELAGFADTRFHICKKPSHWYRDRIKGPRLAAVSCATDDGQHMHVILEQGEEVAATDRILDDPTAVFPVFGNNADELIDGLETLKELAETHTGTLNGAARLWWQKRSSHDKLCLAIAADNLTELLEKTEKAQEHLENSPEKPFSLHGIFYAPEPLAYSGRTAFVYPGSGSHFLGMGQEIAFRFPSIMQRQDMENECLLKQSMSRWFNPYELLWDKEWRQRATDALNADTHKRMFGQVSFGSIVTDIMLKLGLKPNAAIGYSLGESAALFSLRAWPERDMMLRRMEASPLFREYLSGKCLSIRKAWNIPDDKPVNWAAAMILKPQEVVREAMKQVPETRMLIINTDDECVVGGTLEAVKKLNKLLGVRPIIIQGVDTVHCDALAPVADDYEAMHNLPTVPPPGITFYSGNAAKAYDLTAEAIAHSIVSHGVHGFDYTKVIRQAWEDGIRIFIEPGPGSSCARMINKILQDKPHCAVSASMRGYSEITTLMHMLAAIITQGLRPNLGVLYEEEETSDKTYEQNAIEVATCVKMTKPTLPERKPQVIASPAPLPAAAPAQAFAVPAPAAPALASPAPAVSVTPESSASVLPASPAPSTVPAEAPVPCCANAVPSQLAVQPEMPNLAADTLTAKMASAAVVSYQAHESWMRFANYGVMAMGELLSRQTQIMAACLSQGVEIPYMPSPFSASGILGRTLSAEPSA
ncbi:MAG: hypothetical protein K6G50_04465, partial [bacterium]|nr:hypothetical protein [bacterium]